MTNQEEIRLNDKRLEYIERLEKVVERGLTSYKLGREYYMNTRLDLKRAEWSIANLKNQCARFKNRV